MSRCYKATPVKMVRDRGTLMVNLSQQFQIQPP